MKTSTFKTLLVALSSIIFIQQSYADAGIYITVKGNQSFDQMWIFSNSFCTRYFDNGWDGYKMIASNSSVQLYAAEVGGNFQVDAIPDFNNTYLAFKPCTAETEYTLTFSFQELNLYYKDLYLIDSVANKVVNIFTEGTQYAFTSALSNVAVKRFKIVTSNPTPDVVVAPVVVIVAPVVVTTPVEVVTTVEIVVPVEVVIPTPTINSKIYTNKKTIVVENTTKEKGTLSVCDIKSGKVVKKQNFGTAATNYISTTLKTGSYIATSRTLSTNVSTTIIIK